MTKSSSRSGSWAAGKTHGHVLVGAATSEVVGERERIARDAAASVQSAIKGGVVPAAVLWN
jgi:chaperonin GroEL (HSP60 family)